MDFMQRLYAAAARVPGMLAEVVFIAPGGQELPPMKVGFDESTDILMGGEVIAGVPAIKLSFANLPELTTRYQIVMGSRRFTIRHLQRLSDGSEWQVALKESK